MEKKVIRVTGKDGSIQHFGTISDVLRHCHTSFKSLKRALIDPAIAINDYTFSYVPTSEVDRPITPPKSNRVWTEAEKDELMRQIFRVDGVRLYSKAKAKKVDV